MAKKQSLNRYMDAFVLPSGDVIETHFLEVGNFGDEPLEFEPMEFVLTGKSEADSFSVFDGLAGSPAFDAYRDRDKITVRIKPRGNVGAKQSRVYGYSCRRVRHVDRLDMVYREAVLASAELAGLRVTNRVHCAKPLVLVETNDRTASGPRGAVQICSTQADEDLEFWVRFEFQV